MLSRADIRPCRRCHASVRVTTAAGGKTFLVDPDPHPDGNTAVYRDAGGTLRSRRVTKDQPALRWERVMMPHAATCKPKPKEDPPPPPPRRSARTADLHALLGLAAGASASEIRSAYRRLARQLHPDVNPDPAAADRFKRITQAYDLLSGRAR
jgi:hypothetical protein